jgi:hypothetical protein
LALRPAQNTTRSLRRQLALYAIALSYAIALIAGIILTVQDPKLTSAEIASAIGLNLISSVVFAVIFVTLTARIQDRNLETSISELFADYSDRLLDRISEGYRSYYPSVQYPPSGDFNEVFNRDLTNSIEQSNYYFFRGPSPRYLPARIAATKRGLSRVHVAMLDPRSIRALTRRAADRMQRPGFKGKTIDQVVSDLRIELLTSIVALFDCRTKCPIHVIYTLDTAVTRAELCDDSIYLSWYHSPVSPGTVFPETLRFSAGSLVYETFKLDITRQFEIFDNGIIFSSTDTDEDLLAHLTLLTGELISAELLASWRSTYKEFIGKFELLLGDIHQKV